MPVEPSIANASGYAGRVRRGGRAVECTGLENRSPFTRTAGSNPAPSARDAHPRLRAGGLSDSSGKRSRVAQQAANALARPAPAVAERSPAYLNWTNFARAPWPDWKHARLVIGEECLHCGRAMIAAATWRVAIAVVGPDDEPGPERPLGVLHAACIAHYLARAAPRRRRRLTAAARPPTRQPADSARRRDPPPGARIRALRLRQAAKWHHHLPCVLQQRRNYSSHTDAELARAFRVLAHPLRISALRAFAVRDEPLAAGDVAYMEHDEIPATTVRHHLQLLVEAGLLRTVGPRSHGAPGAARRCATS